MVAENSILIAEGSRAEAAAVRVLTIVGTVCLPLGLTATIFSMGGSYAPGETHFWIYWAVALSLLSLAILGIWLCGGLKFGDNDPPQSLERLRMAH